MGGGHQSGVVVPTEPGAALVMVEPELTLELLVVELHLPAHSCQPHEPLGVGVGGQVWGSGSSVGSSCPCGHSAISHSSRGGTSAPSAPPPPSLIIAPAVRSVHAREGEVGGDSLAVRTVAEGDL